MLLLWICLPPPANQPCLIGTYLIIFSCARLCDVLDFRCQLVVDKDQQLCEWPPAWTTESGRKMFDEHEVNLCVTADKLREIAREAAQLLIDNGAREVHAYTTHGVMSGPAVERITNSVLKSNLVNTEENLSRSQRAFSRTRARSLKP